MAVVKKVAAIMTDKELKLLSRLSGTVSFNSYAIAKAASSDFWVVSPKNGRPLKLWGAYRDVEFKFECFYIRIDEHDPAVPPKGSLFDHIEIEVRALELVVSAFWIRKATPGEVPSNWEQVLECRGKLESVPNDATAVCVSVVGILLTDSFGSKQLLCLSDSSPTSIERITDAELMTKILSQSQSMSPREVVALRNRLPEWQTVEGL